MIELIRKYGWDGVMRFFGRMTEQEWMLKYELSNVQLIDEKLREPLKPTQSDKPSAGSSYSRTKAKNRLKDFSKDNCTIYSVLNTNSMEPSIDSNSVIVAEPINDYTLGRQPITVGDILLYEHEWAGKIIHRVVHISIEKKVTKYFLKGDNNFRRDFASVKPEQLVGRYIGQIQIIKTDAND